MTEDKARRLKKNVQESTKCCYFAFENRIPRLLCHLGVYTD